MKKQFFERVNGCVWWWWGALLYLVISGIEIRGRRGAKARDTQTAMCFQSQSFGSFHSLLPNAPENNPTVFFPPACWK